MGEALENYFEAPKSIEKNKKDLINPVLGHIGEVEKYFTSNLGNETRKLSQIGFSKPEQRMARVNMQKLRMKIEELAEKDKNLEVAMDNHLEHVSGNSITITAGRYAERYEERKVVSIEILKSIKKSISLLLFYFEELAEDENLIKKELSSQKGYLENFLEYLSCDLPPETPKQLQLFKFFRNLEKGKITQENFAEATEEVRQYFDVEKIEKDFLGKNERIINA